MRDEQKRAKVGGETGVNGEFYEGGKFLPSTEREKGKPKKKRVGPRKMQVEPYKWEVIEEGFFPIMQIVGAQAQWASLYAKPLQIVPFDHGIAYYGNDWRGYTIDDLCERFNRGERILPRRDLPV